MSTFAWIDHSESQRCQILEAIDTFREKDTRDELGIAGIRDTFSEMLLSGTGSLQTRAELLCLPVDRRPSLSTVPPATNGEPSRQGDRPGECRTS